MNIGGGDAMNNKPLGFIGGGRITRIILSGFNHAGNMPGQIVVSDSNIDVLTSLKTSFPDIHIAHNDNQQPAQQDIVFIALHPPVMSEILGQIKTVLKPTAILVSLAPKLNIAKISEMLNGFNRIARMIPNAPSILNEGYNPVAFSPALSKTEKEELLLLLNILGKSPEVPEDNLEAYAILTAMGPTYLWFQLQELQNIAKSFGLTAPEIEDGITNMVIGTVKTFYGSGLIPEEVMDLVPVKPLKDEEDNIKYIYRTKLAALYNKLKR